VDLPIPAGSHFSGSPSCTGPQLPDCLMSYPLPLNSIGVLVLIFLLLMIHRYILYVTTQLPTVLLHMVSPNILPSLLTLPVHSGASHCRVYRIKKITRLLTSLPLNIHSASPQLLPSAASRRIDLVCVSRFYHQNLTALSTADSLDF
jgi:hypothetical protein